MAGWTAVAAGASKDADVIDRIRSQLGALHNAGFTSVNNVDVRPVIDGWRAEMSGDAETPNDHAAVYSHFESVISGPEPQTGTSEFTSAYITSQNFHHRVEAGYQ